MSLTLKIVAPDKQVINTEVDEIIAPGVCGLFGVRVGHAPMFSELACGVLSYIKSGTEKKSAIAGGILEVNDNVVTVFADTAELAENIDINRAKAACKKTENKLSQLKAADPNIDKLEAKLLRSLARLQCTGNK